MYSRRTTATLTVGLALALSGLLAAAAPTLAHAQITTFPYTEDFENFPFHTSDPAVMPAASGWTNDNTTLRAWWGDAGGTPSSNTGPQFDHTRGNGAGMYIYVEDSDFGGASEEARIYSPALDVSGLTAPTAEFWVHANDVSGAGPTNNQLHVDIENVNTGAIVASVLPVITFISDPTLSVWTRFTVDLTPYQGFVLRVRFRWVGTGTLFQHDIAIDDFRVFDAGTLMQVKIGNAFGPAIGNGGTRDIGQVTPSTPALLNMTILNIDSAATLNLTGSPNPVTFSNALNCTPLLTQPVGTTIAAGANELFGISLDPTTTGAFSCDFTIPSNDPFSPYTFTLVGNTGSIAVIRGLQIPRGGLDNVGPVSQTSGTLALYTVANFGSNPLAVTSVSVSNPVNVTATVIIQPTSPIAPAGSSDFCVSIIPNAATWRFVLTIVHDDAAQTPFTFTVTGVSVAILTQPMSGTYTVDSAQAVTQTNFTDIGDAFTALETLGVSGPVVIEVFEGSGPYQSKPSYSLGGSDNAQFRRQILGVNATNTVTIRAAAGERPVIEGAAATCGIFFKPTGALVIAGVEHVTLDGLTVRSATGFGIFICAQNAPPPGGGVFLPTRFITVRNCLVHDITGGPGIMGYGNDPPFLRDIHVYNNMIHTCTGGGVGGFNFGLLSFRRPDAGVVVEHNTVMANGTVTGGNGTVSFAGAGAAGPDRFANNLVITSTNGTPHVHMINGQIPRFADGNVYYNNAAAPGPFAQDGGGPVATFANWQAIYGFDPTGLDGVDPLVVSMAAPIDLHLQATSPARDRGVYVPFTVDYDNDSRILGAGPDAGADEVIAGGVQNIEVQRAGVPIAPGGTDNLGATIYGTGVATPLTYEIRNNGGIALTVGAVNITANANCTVTVTTPPVSPVAYLGSTTVTLTVTPSASPFTFTFEITNGSATRNPYVVDVIGTAGAAAPAMVWLDSQGTAQVDPGTSFVGDAFLGQVVDYVHTILNTGNDFLTLQAPLVSIVGMSGCTATLPVLPTSPIAPLVGETTFTVRVTPTATGTFTVDLQIISDDPTNPTWDVQINGNGLDQPRIVVRRAGNVIGIGAVDNVGAIDPVNPTVFTYTIENTGTQALNLNPAQAPNYVFFGTTVCNGSAVISTPPNPTIAVAGNTTFDVTYTPGMAGAFEFVLVIESDDPFQNPFVIIVRGTAGSFGPPGGGGPGPGPGGGGGGGGGCSALADPTTAPGNAWLLLFALQMVALALRYRTKERRRPAGSPLARA